MMINNQKGQATIEFILSMILVLAFLFLFITLGINHTLGYVVQYVTYMSGRTYLSYDNGSNEIESAIQSAESESKKTFARFKLDAIGLSPSQLQINSPLEIEKKVYVGVYYFFQKPFNLYSIGNNEDNQTNFLSEAFLGKEPTNIDCYNQVCSAMGITNCSKASDVTLFDNGC
jgi:hypothetical protein